MPQHVRLRAVGGMVLASTAGGPGVGDEPADGTVLIGAARVGAAVRAIRFGKGWTALSPRRIGSARWPSASSAASVRVHHRSAPRCIDRTE